MEINKTLTAEIEGLSIVGQGLLRQKDILLK